MSETGKPDTSAIDVSYVAHLARLDLTDDERRRFQDQLEDIVQYVRTIRSLDLDDVPPTSHPHVTPNVFRRDEVRPSLAQAEVLENAPEVVQSQFRVPKIVE